MIKLFSAWYDLEGECTHDISWGKLWLHLALKKSTKRYHPRASKLIYLTKIHITKIFEEVDRICYFSRLTQSSSIKHQKYNRLNVFFYLSTVLATSSSPSEWKELLGSQKSPWKSFWVFWTFKDRYLNVQPGHRSLQTLPPSPSPNSQCLVHGLHLR